MMTRQEILDNTFDKWKEHIEMYPGQEAQVMSLLLASELQQVIEEKEYYKRLCHARISTKH
jgi:hypothetical protein